MALRALKTNFVAGELDPLLKGRSDIKHYHNGVEIGRNVYIVPEGGASSRPGLLYVAEVADIPVGDGGGNSAVAVCQFQFSTEQTYLLVFSHKRIEIFKDDEKVAEVETPYTSSDIDASYTATGDLVSAGIGWTQSKDTLLIFHELYQTRVLKRLGSHIDWGIELFDFQNVARYDFGEATYNDPLVATGSHPLGGGTPANLTDGDPATTSTPTAIGDLTGLGISARLLAKLDLGEITDIGGVVATDLRCSGSATDDCFFAYSDDGVEWFAFGDIFKVLTSADTFDRRGNLSARYVAIALPAINHAGKTFTIGEFEAAPYTAGSDEIQEIEFPNPGSQGDWTDGDTFIAILQDEKSDNIRYRPNADQMASNLEAALRLMRITSKSGITVRHDGTSASLTKDVKFKVTFSGGDGSKEWGALSYEIKSSEQIPSIDIYVVTRGRAPGEYVFSDARGWPRCGTFFQGRLWVAGTPSLPHWLWATRSGSINDFSSELFSDDYGIAIPADQEDVPAFLNIYAGRHLQLFATSAEFYVPVSDREGVTPGNVSLRRSTSQGSRAGLPIFDVDGASHFIQRGGKSLREFIYADVEASYQANNISLLAPHLIRQPVDYALRRAVSTSEPDFEFMCNSDGTVTLFCTLRTQEVNGMVLWRTEGDFKAAGAVLDDVYFAIRRTIDGVSRIFIEKMSFDVTVDCAIRVSDLGAPVSEITVDHLPNTAIEHLLDGVIQAPIDADADGKITLARDAQNSWVAGLRFKDAHDDYPGLVWVMKTLPLEFELPDGATMGRKRRLVDITVRLQNTSALKINGETVPFRKFGSSLLDAQIEPFTGIKRLPGRLGWDFDGAIVLGSDVSLSATVISLAYGVQI